MLHLSQEGLMYKGLGLVDSKWLQILEQPLCHEVMWNQQAGILKMPTSHLQHEIISNASVLGKRSIAEMTIPSANGPARSEMGLLLSGVSQKVGELRINHYNLSHKHPNLQFGELMSEGWFAEQLELHP
ncbi:hypothetical protein Tco_0183053, partial [Tanacetum coccineum]